MLHKVTPYKDISWYIKWTASYILIIATIINATGMYHTYDVSFKKRKSEMESVFKNVNR